MSEPVIAIITSQTSLRRNFLNLQFEAFPT